MSSLGHCRPDRYQLRADRDVHVVPRNGKACALTG